MVTYGKTLQLSDTAQDQPNGNNLVTKTGKDQKPFKKSGEFGEVIKI